MTELKDERPGVGTEALEDHLRRSTSIVTESRTYPPKIQLSDSAEAYIAGLSIDLALAEVGLEQLPGSLLEFYTLAFEQGRASLRDRINRLEWLVDGWYWVASNKGKTFADLYGHRTSELWNAAVSS